MSLSIHTARDEKSSPAPLSSSSSSSSSSSRTKNESNVVLSRADNDHSPAVPREKDATVVSFEPNDPENPHNWSFVRHPPFSHRPKPNLCISTNPFDIPPDNQEPHLPNRLPLHHNHVLLLHPTLQLLTKPTRRLPGSQPDRPAARAPRVAVPSRLHIRSARLVRNNTHLVSIRKKTNITHSHKILTTTTSTGPP